MVSAGVMGTDLLAVTKNTEVSNFEVSETKSTPFDEFMDSAKSDADVEVKDVKVGSTQNDKSEEIKNLFEKSNVNQGNAPDKITEEEIVEAAEELVGDLIKNIVEIVSEVMEISKQEVETAIKELDLDASALLNKNGLSELMKHLTGKENVIELVTNSELSDMFKNIVQQVEESTKLFIDSNPINKEQLVEMLSEVDIEKVLSEENVEEVSIENEPHESVDASYQPKEIENETDNENEPIIPEKEPKLDVAYSASELNQTSENHGSGMSQNNQTLAQNFTESLVNAIEEIDIEMDIEPQQIIRQIVDEVRLNVNENVRSLEMQLNPESLGKLNIQLVSKNGEVTANIMAQTEAAKEVIEAQVAILKENLIEQGVKVEAVEVTVASRSFDENLGDQERAKDEQKPKKHISQKELDEINGIQSVSDIIEEEMMRQSGNTVSIKA